MFVTTAVEEEEAQELVRSSYGVSITQKADYLRGPAGNLLKEVASRCGIFMEQCYYTAIIKWLLPKAKRNSPKMQVLKWGMPVLLDEISRVKPKIIVCLGKKAFDMLCDQKMNFADAHGGWFWSSKAQAHIYLMHSPYMLIPKPEWFEMFRVDLTEVARKLQIIKDGGEIQDLPVNIEVIQSLTELRQWRKRMEDGGYTLLSGDSEWHGQNHIDGQLRSLQFAWTDTDACYIRFRDEKNQFAFDMEGWEPPPEADTLTKREAARYRHIGSVIAEYTDRPEVKFVGHHYVADAVWWDHVLGMKVIGKCYLDTEFAQQTVDEASELKLERGIAMKYTTLGRYDLELVLWKKANKALCEDGYGFIPESILVPYACLAWDSKVQLGDGSWEEIHKLVDRKYDGTVMALVDGKVKPCRVTNWKKSKKVGQKWFRVVTHTTRGAWKGGSRSDVGSGVGYAGPRFTEDHKILTNEGYVRVDELTPGRHKIATADRELTLEQRQIVLGSMLGDGGLIRRNRAGGYIFRCSQSGRRTPYAQWKADNLGNVLSFRRYYRPAWDKHEDWLSFTSTNHIGIANLVREFPRAASKRGHFEITESILEAAGDLGLAVWFMDDGTTVQEGRSAKLYRKTASPSEQQAGQNYLQRRFGSEVSYNPGDGSFYFYGRSYVKFMAAVKPYFHPSVAYKHAEPDDIVAAYEVDQSDVGVVYETIEKVVPADRPRGNKKMECFRYCLTVPEAGNFLTKAGFVSNCKDVLAVFRAVPIIRKLLDAQRLWTYYEEIFNPFVTDVFFTFAQSGLPMDVELMDQLRLLFNFVRKDLDAEFRQSVVKDAKARLFAKLVEVLGSGGPIAAVNTVNLITNGDIELAWADLKKILPLNKMSEARPFLDQLACAPTFNIRAPDQMRRWLYEVSGMTPVKSTNQKANGMPSMAWEKVLELPKDRQALYTPSVDKQTLSIMAEKLPLANELLDLNVVGNLCKAFLKEPEVYFDEDEGEEVVEEAGLHKWLASNGRIHGQTSTTETGRPLLLSSVMVIANLFNSGGSTEAIPGEVAHKAERATTSPEGLRIKRPEMGVILRGGTNWCHPFPVVCI